MISDPPRATTLMACFNCRVRSEQVHLWRFDLDLPPVKACKACQACRVALACNDHETLAALRPSRAGRQVR